MARIPKNVVGVSPDTDLDPKHFLGRVASYRLPDEPVNGAKLVRSWHKHGLDVEWLPDARQPVHVFQSACRSVETRTRTNGKAVEVKVDEVLHDSGECVYQITRMVRDKAEKLIEHPKAMRVSFDKRTSLIEVDELDEYEALRGLEDNILTHFHSNAKTVPGQKVRNAVRDVILRIGGQNMKGKTGGVYFVPNEYRYQVPGNGIEMRPTQPLLGGDSDAPAPNGLSGVLADLYGSDRSDFWTIPLLTSDHQKKMVAKHFALNVRAQLDDLTEKAVNRARAGKGTRGVRQDMLAGMWNERRRLLGSVEQFEELVGLERSRIADDLKDLDVALEDLQELADTEG